MDVKKKILFVDDEAKVLGGLRRMLRGQRHEWDMVFVESGEEALACLDDAPFDIVVTDMRMPSMDGAELLGHIVQRHPSVVRMVLSGQCKHHAVLKCVGPAHQFLTKPCEPETLKATIARACHLQDRLFFEQIQKAISCVQTIPSHPDRYGELVEACRSATPSIQRISDIISQDPAMGAKALQLVSSGFLGTPQVVYDVPHAIRLLGAETIRELIEQTDVFLPPEQNSVLGNCLDRFSQHELVVAAAAKTIAEAETDDATLINSAYLAGMLHDIAAHIFAKDFSESHSGEIVAAEERCPKEIMELILTARHDIAGAYLMGLWGLPDSIVNTIAYHLVPSDSPDREFGPLAAVHVANATIEKETDYAIGASLEVDHDFLERIGCADRLAEWQELCLSADREGVLS